MESNKLSTVIVDDEQEAIDYLIDLLSEHMEITLLASFTDPVKAIAEIGKLQPNVLFLDVQMPVKTGFDVIKEIRSDDYSPYIVFTTAFEKFAIRAIKYAAFDYLIKPVNPFELETAIQNISTRNHPLVYKNNYNKLLSGLSEAGPVKFNTGNGFVLINPDEISYLEASRNYCEIHLKGNRMELVSVNMLHVNKVLPDTSFFRISRFHTVNLALVQKVNRIKKECYLLADGQSIALKVSGDRVKELEGIFK